MGNPDKSTSIQEHVAAVMTYSDYREFLKIYYRTQKQRDYHYSLARMAKRADLNSASHLKMIMDGLRNISATKAVTLGRSLGLSGIELDYFVTLTKLNQSKDAVDRDVYLRKLTSYQKRSSTIQANIDTRTLLKHWYTLAILNLARIDGFCDNPLWISQRLFPRVSPIQISESLALLKSANLLVNIDGSWQTNCDLSIHGEPSASEAVRTYHRQSTALANKALDWAPVDQRDFASQNIALSRQAFELLKCRIHEFAHELASWEQSEGSPEQVYQVNLHVFPLTHPSSAPAASKAAVT